MLLHLHGGLHQLLLPAWVKCCKWLLSVRSCKHACVHCMLLILNILSWEQRRVPIEKRSKIAQFQLLTIVLGGPYRS